jgi:hypothetical protein
MTHTQLLRRVPPPNCIRSLPSAFAAFSKIFSIRIILRISFMQIKPSHSMFSRSLPINPSFRYLKLVRDYHSVIAGQFFGHFHSDSFRVFYEKMGKSQIHLRPIFFLFNPFSYIRPLLRCVWELKYFIFAVSNAIKLNCTNIIIFSK